jgi:PAS domain S-box-containing protein
MLFKAAAHMTIRKKMILILLGSSLIPLCMVAVLGYYHARKALESVRMEGLRSIAVLKAEQIEGFFNHHKKHIIVAQQRPTLKKNAALLAGLSDDFTNPAYEAIREELDQALKTYQPVYNFINIMLVNPEGRIVYVLNRSAAPELLGHFLTDLWEGAVHDKVNGIQFSDIFASRFAADTFSVFAMTPIQSFANQYVGAIVFEIDMAPIYKLIQDTTGLGVTGETLIAKKMGDGALFLNPLRHDPDAALQRKVAFGEKRAMTIQQALTGKDGIGMSVDYRGKKVIAAWRYLPSLDWGMVAKIDASEAFEPVASLRGFVIILLAAVLIIELVLSVLVSKSISAPIRSLILGTEAVGAGDLDYAIGTGAQDEIGQLSRAFDQMTQKLKRITASRDDLDLEVKARKNAEKALQKSMEELARRVNELNCLYEISHLAQKRNLPLDTILQEIVDLIPSAMKRPVFTGARIQTVGGDYQTRNFKETNWMLAQDIHVLEKKLGTLVICLLKQPPAREAGAFLKEETDLIAAVAERIGKIIERRDAQAALVESETRFRQLVEHSLTGISIIQDGRIVYQNPEQERLLGHLPRPIIFEDIENIHQDDIAKVAQFYQNLIAGQWQYTDTEFRFYPASGKKGSPTDMRWIHCRASRIEYEGKSAILLNIDEVTRAKRLENLLRIQDKMSSLGRVAAGIAHEIRNPLSGINIYLNTLRKLYYKDGSEEKVGQILDQLQSASRKIESVIRRVMDFTKSSEPQLSLMDINGPIEEAINLSAVSLRKRNIRIEKNLAGNLPLCYLDAQLIEQVLLNLITNSAEAMKDDKQEPKIIAITSAVVNDQIQVSVSDSGPGVPPESREIIFDPFYTTKNGSSGIGLSLSHRIIADHGGTLIALAGQLGGAEFRIEIPVNREKPIEAGDTHSKNREQA